ncbi:hypothetical protein AXK11_07935 [Cephaloticoccus primus]|uniref:TonB-dependent receptor plug domain-containing protein n=1 Tax=Cephaloticoccus primus TaxID=1548207 RepID=A0A139SJE5_9BACT|nr:TonB-dependent receptor plug domain-containing protein [Cephaloticoccus primus]KXU34651.1 hypothetical protein AXK11_07935 [Cephaloticoccus primus]
MKRQAWLVPALLALGLPLAGHAQSVNPRDSLLDQSATEEFVELPVFGVSSDRVDGYRAVDSSTARIRRELIDTPTTINVITSEFMDDIGAASITDAIMYVSGVGPAPMSGLAGLRDDVMIRGFQAHMRTIDGFVGFGSFQASIDPAVIERAEVLKGPNEFLVPQGEPGGGYNVVTKSPLFDPFNEVKVEVADNYFGNRAVFDMTDRVPGTENFAWRIIGSWRDSPSYVPGRLINKTLNPMLTWRPSSSTQLKVKVNLFNWRQTGRQAGNHNTLRIRDDVPHGTVISVDDIDPRTKPDSANGHADWKYKDVKPRRVTTEFTTKLWEQVSLRVAGLYEYRPYYYFQGGTRLDVDWGGTRINPLTGEYSPTETWTRLDPLQPYDPVTNPLITAPYNPVLNSVALYEEENYNYAEEVHYQADLYGGFDFGNFRGAPLGTFSAAVGASYGSGHSENKWVHQVPKQEDITGSPYFDFDNRWSFVPPRPQKSSDEKRVDVHTANPKTRRSQFYINTQTDFFQKRFQINLGLTHRQQRSEGDINYTTENFTRNYSTVKKTTPTVAALYKVTPQTSVYAAHTKNSDPGRHWNGSEDVDHWSDGRMYEVGAKQEFFNRRLFVTGSYFDIAKTNIVSGHPDNWQFPEGSQDRFADILSDRSTKGFEFDVTGAITPNLSAVASYTKMKVRDERGQPMWNAAEVMYNAMVKYSFRNGPATGLNLNFGFNHVGKVAPEGSRMTDLGVLITPEFYVPARTIFNAGASYKYRSVSFQLNVENVFDRRIVWAAQGRESVGIHPKRNIRLTTSYSF